MEKHHVLSGHSLERMNWLNLMSQKERDTHKALSI